MSASALVLSSPFGFLLVCLSLAAAVRDRREDEVGVEAADTADSFLGAEELLDGAEATDEVNAAALAATEPDERTGLIDVLRAVADGRFFWILRLSPFFVLPLDAISR